jgi:GNAT superfamily N-acetyltransferase
MHEEIRRATIQDAEVLARYNAAMARETEGKTLHAATLRRGVEAVINDEAKGFYLVVCHDGVVVGQCLLTKEWSDWRAGWYWWFQSVYVDPSARRQGVFQRLYRHVQQLALAEGDVIGLRLYVERENTRAQATYVSLGMIDEHYTVMGEYPLPGMSKAFE